MNLADRLGGVMFDVQKHREGIGAYEKRIAMILNNCAHCRTHGWATCSFCRDSIAKLGPSTLRDKLIASISDLCALVETMDNAELHGTNPRIGNAVEYSCYALADECGAISKDGFDQFWSCTWRKGHPTTRQPLIHGGHCLGRKVFLFVKPTGITLAGWHCPVTACGVFNSEEKEQRSECKSCGAKVKVER